MPRIDFLGKGDVVGHHLSVPFRTLEADKKKSVGDPDLDGNLIIHGDNLFALKALLPRYQGKVKCIYIDPPYNTGNERWCYNDKVNSPMMREWFEKNVSIEDQTRHDKWLCMMYPRLQLLKELLSDDGVIFISIDANEQHHLHVIMDEIFGSGNLINNFCYVNNLKGRQTSNVGAVGTFEYILSYAKSVENIKDWKINVKKATNLMENIYRMNEVEIFTDDIGKYTIKNKLHNTNKFFNETTRPNLVFNIHYSSKTGDIQFSDIGSDKKFPGFVKIPPKEIRDDKNKYRAWRWGKDKIINEKHNLLFKKENGNFSIYTKIRDFTRTNLKDIIMGIPSGKSRLEKLGIEFPNPKSVDLIKIFIEATTEKTDIVLDSFSGSGTTADAVLTLNKEDNGERKFILVECEDKIANKVTAERVRRVIRGVPKTRDESLKKGLGGSFTYATLGDEIDHEKLLSGKSMPSWTVLARHVFWLATGKTLNKDPKPNKNFLVGKHQNNSVYLLYEPNVKFLQSNKAALTGDVADKLGDKRKSEERIIYYAAASYVSQKDMQKSGITFCQLPWSITKQVKK